MGFIVGAILSVVMAALSTWQGLRMQKQQAETAEAVAEGQEVEAELARDAAAFEERQTRRRNALLLGKQRAIFAAAQVDPRSGTPLLQDLDFVKQAELEALNVRKLGVQASEASNFEARIARYRRDTAKAAMPFIVAGGVLQAASGVTQAGMSSYSSTGSVLGSWGQGGYSRTSSGFTARRV